MVSIVNKDEITDTGRTVTGISINLCVDELNKRYYHGKVPRVVLSLMTYRVKGESSDCEFPLRCL